MMGYIDIETYNDKIKHGFAVGDLSIMHSVASTGKSIMAKKMASGTYGTITIQAPKFIKYDDADVDGNLWHSVRIDDEIYNWLLMQDRDMWADHGTRSPGGSYGIDVHEQLYTLLVLRWT